MDGSDDNLTNIPLLPQALEQAEDADEGRERRDLIIARAGARLFGIFADEAAGVTKWHEPVPLPRAPQGVFGIVSVRGRMLTVLDPLHALGLGESAEQGEPRYLLALRGDEQLALAVDATESIIEIFTDEIQPVEHGTSVAHGHITREGERIAILKTEEIFAAATLGTERRRQRG